MGVAVNSFMAFGASQVATPGPAKMALGATGALFGILAAFPFVLDVAMGKQMAMWPVGFGPMTLAENASFITEVFNYISVAYIAYLAWKIAYIRLDVAGRELKKPGFFADLLVHPLNPKARAMIVVGFKNFVLPGRLPLQAAATIAICLIICQMVFHPIWALGGDQIAKTGAGISAEVWLMRVLAGLSVFSVLFVLFGGTDT
ncbi:MAG: LysE family translocator [Cognatishimia sp.]